MKLFELNKIELCHRFSVETNSDYPDTVYMHGSAHGFTSCFSFTKQQAIDLAAALVDFATADETETETEGGAA